MADRFIIWPGDPNNSGVVDNILQRIQDARGQQKPTSVEIKPYHRKRSTEQNARLWVLHSLYAKWLNEQADELKDQLRAQIRKMGKPKQLTELLGQYVNLSHPWTAEAVHEIIFKPRYVHPRLEKSSTRLTTAQMAEAQEEYEAYMVSLGIDTEE